MMFTKDQFLAIKANFKASTRTHSMEGIFIYHIAKFIQFEPAKPFYVSILDHTNPDRMLSKQQDFLAKCESTLTVLSYCKAALERGLPIPACLRYWESITLSQIQALEQFLMYVRSEMETAAFCKHSLDQVAVKAKEKAQAAL